MQEKKLLKENLKEMVAQKIAIELCIQDTMSKLVKKHSFTLEDELEIEKAFILLERKRLKERLKEIDLGLPF